MPTAQSAGPPYNFVPNSTPAWQTREGYYPDREVPMSQISGGFNNHRLDNTPSLPVYPPSGPLYAPSMSSPPHIPDIGWRVDASDYQSTNLDWRTTPTYDGTPSPTVYGGPPPSTLYDGPPPSTIYDGPPPYTIHNGPPPSTIYNGPSPSPTQPSSYYAQMYRQSDHRIMQTEPTHAPFGPNFSPWTNGDTHNQNTFGQPPGLTSPEYVAPPTTPTPYPSSHVGGIINGRPPIIQPQSPPHVHLHAAHSPSATSGQHSLEQTTYGQYVTDRPPSSFPMYPHPAQNAQHSLPILPSQPHPHSQLHYQSYDRSAANFVEPLANRTPILSAVDEAEENWRSRK